MQFDVREIQESDLVPLAKSGLGQWALNERRLNAQRAGTNTFLVAATADGTIVGHVGISWKGSFHDHLRSAFPELPEIQALRVSPFYQNRGIAKRLLWEAEAHALSAGATAVGLCVGEANEVALNIYKRSGWRLSEIESFESQKNETPQTVLHMTKQLSRDFSHESLGVGISR